jgi:hypothetical protein
MIASVARQRRRGISTSTRRARKQGDRSAWKGGGNGRTYLWALQSRSIRMSSSEDSAAAARPATAGPEHIPRPRARAAAAAASPAPRRASATAMPARRTHAPLRPQWLSPSVQIRSAARSTGSGSGGQGRTEKTSRLLALLGRLGVWDRGARTQRKLRSIAFCAGSRARAAAMGTEEGSRDAARGSYLSTSARTAHRSPRH